MEAKLYVGNFSYTTEEADLRALFAKAGQVEAVILIKDHNTGDAKGFAFIEMKSQAEAEKAIQMLDGVVWNNRELKVSLARPREERNGGSGQRGRGRRY